MHTHTHTHTHTNMHHTTPPLHTHTHTQNINFILLTTLSLYISQISLSFTTLVLNMWVVGWVTAVSYIPRNMVKNFVPSIMPQKLCDVYVQQ